MSKTEEIGKLISECLDLCHESGYSLKTLVRFLDHLRTNGQPEMDVQRVDFMMRGIIMELLLPDELPPDAVRESPTITDFGDTIQIPREPT